MQLVRKVGLNINRLQKNNVLVTSITTVNCT